MIPLKDDNPAEITPIVTVGFIAACVLVFLYQASLPEQSGEVFVFQFGAIPATVFGNAALPPEVASIPPFVSLITSMFLHGGWMHLIGNMLYLWIFGNNIEDAMGHVKFVIFYITCGIVAVYSHAITDPTSTVPMVGASGAISGVLGAYILLFPHAQVLVLDSVGLLHQDHVCAGRSGSRPVVFAAGAQRRHEPGTIRGRRSLLRSRGRILAGMALIGLFKRSDVRFFAPQRHSSWQKFE